MWTGVDGVTLALQPDGEGDPTKTAKGVDLSPFTILDLLDIKKELYKRVASHAGRT